VKVAPGERWDEKAVLRRSTLSGLPRNYGLRAQMRRTAMSKHSADSGYLAIGLDVGDRFCHFCVVDATGEIVEEGRMATTPRALGLGFASRPRVRVDLEVRLW
jgi:hypothetical protein